MLYQGVCKDIHLNTRLYTIHNLYKYTIIDMMYTIIDKTKIMTNRFSSRNFDEIMTNYLILLEDRINLLSNMGIDPCDNLLSHIFVAEIGDVNSETYNQHITSTYKYSISTNTLTKNSIGIDEPYFGNELSESSRRFMYRLSNGVYMNHNNTLQTSQMNSQVNPQMNSQVNPQMNSQVVPSQTTQKKSVADALNSAVYVLKDNSKITKHIKEKSIIPNVIIDDESEDDTEYMKTDSNSESRLSCSVNYSIDSCSLDIHSSDIEKINIDQVKDTLDNLVHLKKTNKVALDNLEQKKNNDEKNYVEYKYNINCDEHKLKKIKEKKENNVRIFLSDRDFTYKKIKENIDNGTVYEADIPGMFVEKYPIFKYMDENNILFGENAYDIYNELYYNIHSESESNSDEKQNSDYVPHNVHYLEEDQKKKYMGKLNSQQNDGIFVKNKQVESLDSIIKKLDDMEQMENLKNLDRCSMSDNDMDGTDSSMYDSDSTNDSDHATGTNSTNLTLSVPLSEDENLINSFEESSSSYNKMNELNELIESCDSECESSEASDKECEKSVKTCSESQTKNSTEHSENNCQNNRIESRQTKIDKLVSAFDE